MTCRLLLLILSIDTFDFLLMSYLCPDPESSDSLPMKSLEELLGIIPLTSHVLLARLVVKSIFLDNSGYRPDKKLDKDA